MSDEGKRLHDSIRQSLAEQSPGYAKSLEFEKRDEAEKAEAIRILESDDPLAEIKLHLDNLLAGEDATKQLVFLLCLSGKINDPKKKQIIELLGDAGGGKTMVANAITQLYKTKKVGRFSKRALDYSDLQGYEILYLQEIGAMDKEDQGVSTLKFLSADDDGYTVVVSVYDADEQAWTTQTIKIPPITVVTSTTRTDIDPQFQRRSWLINVDQTHAQTLEIERWKIDEKQEGALVTLGLETDTRAAKSKRILTHLVNQIENTQVFMPFPKSIFGILDKDQLRVRGDMDKFWILAYLYNVLLQRKLLKGKIKGRNIVCASPAKTSKMFTITKHPLITMTLNLEGRYLDFIEAMKTAGYSKRGDRVTMDGRNAIRKAHGRSTNTVYRYLDDLFKREFFTKEKGEKGVVEFVLRDDLNSLLQKQSEIAGILDIPTTLGLKMIEEAQNFIDGVLERRLGGGIPPGHEDTVSLLKSFSNTLSDEKEWLSAQKEVETVGISDIPPESPPVPDIANAGLQDKMNWILGELSFGTKSVSELVEKSGMVTTEIDSILALMARDKVAFRALDGTWRAST